ncbi:DUF4214 domain-containing protein [Prochlorococcus marinus]|uniref:DUF4214 domain-containing protein n=1 Tax=Prochlorococcus marinus TaxID=1219 RepID=UPI0022B38561|nr:DUF4214 domain-containing protein [Prochlorococcus marinus]
MTATATQLQQLYIAYFGRAADPEGLDYWVSAGTTLKQFAAHMDGQNEWISVKSGKTTSQQIDQLYQNLFNRNADTDGKTYWTAQIDAGNIKLAELGEYLRSSALNGADSDDKTILLAKTTAAEAITAQIRLSVSATKEYKADSSTPYIAGSDLTAAKTFLGNVGASGATTAEINAHVADIGSYVDSITVDSTSVNEGASVTFSIECSSNVVSSGELIPYVISGVSVDDLATGTLSGNFTVGADGKANVTITLKSDSLTEGSETLTLTAAGKSKAVTVADTSTTPEVVTSISVDSTSVNEGGSVTFSIECGSSVSSGDLVPYTISGISVDDLTSGSLSGNFTVGADSKANVTITLKSDSLTEGSETLTLTAAGKSKAVTVADTSTTAATQTSFTVTASEIATNNAKDGANAVTVTTPSTGSSTVVLNTDGITSDGGFVVSGNSSTTLTAGTAADTITLDSDGNSTVTSGAGNDSVTIVGSGNNTVTAGAGDDTVTASGAGNQTIDLGAGGDTVTTGAGDDTITIGSGDFSTADLITAGLGTDKVIISGTGNTITTADQLAGVETLELAGTGVTIDASVLTTLIADKLATITGSSSSSDVIIDGTAGAAEIDLTGLTLTTLKSLTATSGTGGDGKITIKLSATQIGQVGSFGATTGDSLQINTTVAGLDALSGKTGFTISVTDTITNLLATSTSLSGVAVALGNVTVAQAKSVNALTTGSLTYTLSDSAANLALAPQSVFGNNCSALIVEGNATSAQAVAIDTQIDTANSSRTTNLNANTVTLNVVDAATLLADNNAGLVFADSVSITGGAATNLATAKLIYTGNANATYSVTDTATNLHTGRAEATLDQATAVTLSTSVTAEQATAINAAITGTLTSGYTVTGIIDSSNANGLNATANTAVVTAATGGVTVSSTNISVADSLVANALTGGTKSYVLDDTLTNLLAAPSTTVSATSTVSITGSNSLTVTQMNDLITKFGATKVVDSNITVTGTSTQLASMSAGSVADATTITWTSDSSDTVTVAELNALKTLCGTISNFSAIPVSDTVANLVTAASNTTSTANLVAAGTITATGNATVAQISTINTALSSVELEATFAISDSATNVKAATSGADLNAVQDAASIAITGNLTVAELDTIFTAASSGSALVRGTTLTYNISDTAANIFSNSGVMPASGATNTQQKATAITVSDGVSVAQVVSLNSVRGNYTGATFTIEDTVSNIDGAATTVTAAAASVVAEDSLTNLNSATTAQKAKISSYKITGTVDPANTGTDVTQVNTLAAAKTTVYNLVSSTYAELTSSTTGVSTFVNAAAALTISDDVTVAKYNTVNGSASGTVTAASLKDSVANLAGTDASTAITNASAVALTSGASTAATKAQLATLAAAGSGLNTVVASLDVTDTASNIAACLGSVLTRVDSVTISDDTTSITVDVAQALAIFDSADDGSANTNSNPDGSLRATYTISDTAANIVAQIDSDSDVIKNASAVTVTSSATNAEAAKLLTVKSMAGAISYNVSDTSANIFSGGSIATDANINGATNVTVTDALSVAEATDLVAATNSGTNTYTISDTSANLAAASAASANGATSIAASDNATGAQASAIAAFTSTSTYNISDTSANLGLDATTTAGLNGAGTIAATGSAVTAAIATKLLSATNSGATTIAAVTDTSTAVKALSIPTGDAITTLTASGTTTIADAVTINAIGAGTTAFSTVSGSGADIISNITVSAKATNVTVTGTVTAAQGKTINDADDGDGGTSYAYSISDTYENLMLDAAQDGTFDYAAAIVDSTTTTVTDDLNLAQFAQIKALDSSGAFVYNIVDNDANIVTHLDANQTRLTGAASVKGEDGTALTITTITLSGTATTAIEGTKASIAALSDVLNSSNSSSNVRYTVSVSDLTSDSDFYATLASNQQFRVTDTAANLAGGNALIPSAVKLTATDNATAAQVTTIDAISAADYVLSVSDTATNVVALGSTLNGLVNVATTDGATFAQTATIADSTNSGTTTFTISDTASNATSFVSTFSTAEIADVNAASSITVTGSVAHDVATKLLARTPAVTLGTVTGTSAQLAAVTVGSGDTVATMTASDAATAAEATTMLASATSVTAYSLTDTAAAIVAASTAVRNGSNLITASGNTTLAQSRILDAATGATDTNTVFTLADSAANILSATATELARGNGSNNTVTATDASVSAATATSLRDLDTAQTTFIVAGAGGTGNFTLSDTSANLTASANANALAASSNVTITDAVSITTANSVIDGSKAASTVAYELTGTFASLLTSSSGIKDGGTQGGRTLTVSKITVTDAVTLAQANAVDGWGLNGSATDATLVYNITDTVANLIAGTSSAEVAARNSATSLTVTGTQTVAQAALISEYANLSGTYSITDSAANIYSALNTQFGSAGASDRALLTGAASISLTTGAFATVQQALGDQNTTTDASETRGLSTVSNLSYSIKDTAANLITGLARTDKANLTSATTVELSNTTQISLANYTTLTTEFGTKFKGHDADADSSTDGLYYIKDSVDNLLNGSSSVVNGASGNLCISDTFANLSTNGGVANIKLAFSKTNVDIVVTDAITIAQHVTLDALNGSGTITYDITDAKANVFASSGSSASYATGAASVVNNATNVSLSDAIIQSQAATINTGRSGLSTVTFDLTDSNTNLFGGDNSLDNSAVVAAAANVSITGTTNATQATAVNTARGDLNEVTFAVLSDTAANLGTNGAVVNAALGQATAVSTTAAGSTAAQLNYMDANAATGVEVDATAATGVDGVIADVLTATADTSGVINVDTDYTSTVTGDQASTLSSLNTLMGRTTGNITATIGSGTAAAIDTALSNGSATDVLDITTGSTTTTAAVINSLDGKTSADVDVSAITAITGTVANGATMVGNDGSGSGLTLAANYTFGATAAATTTTHVANIDSIADNTSGVVTATITGSSSLTAAQINSNLGTIGGSDALTVTLHAATAAATDLTGIDGKTSVTVDAQAVTGITSSTLANTLTATADSTINVDGDFTAAVSDADAWTDGTAATAGLNLLLSRTTGAVTATVTGDTVANIMNGTTGLKDMASTDSVAITITDTADAAADLNALDAKTGGTVTATTITNITSSTIESIEDAHTSSGLSLDTDWTATFSNTGALSNAVLDDLGTVRGATTGAITGSLTGVAANLVSRLGDSDEDTLTITLSDTSVASADVNTLDAETSVAIVATGVATFTGTEDAFSTLLAAHGSGGISIDTDYNVTVNSGTPDLADINTIMGDTSGTVTATLASTTVAALTTALSNHSSGGDALTVTVSDTSDAAADIKTLNDRIGGSIIATSITNITASTIAATVDVTTGGISGSNSNAGTAVVWDGDWTASLTDTGALSNGDLDSLDDIRSRTTGAITIGNGSAITGTLSNINTRLSSSGADAMTFTLGDSVSDLSADLVALDAKTSVIIDASAIDGFSGTAANGATLADQDTSTVTLKADYTYGLSAAVTDATGINNLDKISANTTGTVTGAISGLTAAAINSDLAANGGADALTITVSAGTAAATDLTGLDAKTSVAVAAGAITTVTGTTLEAAAVVAGSITMDGGVTYTLSDNASAYDATAGALVTLNGATTTAINASAVATITGTATNWDALLSDKAAGEVTLKADFAGKITSASTVANLEAVDAVTTGAVYATALTDNFSAIQGADAALIKLSVDGTGSTVTVNGTGAANTIDLSTVTGAAGKGFTIVAGDGDDNITGASGGTSSDIFRFEATASGNGSDTITSFSHAAPGSGGDKLDISAGIEELLDNTAGANTSILKQAINAAATSREIIALSDTNVGNATALKAAMDLTTHWDETNLGQKLVLWEIAADTSIGVAYVSNTDTANDASVSVTQIATLTNIADTSALLADITLANNFVLS